ncbi:hypothetical protein M0802_005533 [Mischocyttarus mexicanus]|nr:hypothetical protein M0802_005533 [Mischocyttarus mexicanus]
MRFFKINRVREILVPHYGKSVVEKIKFLWNLGWQENPVMTLCVLTVPAVSLYTIYFVTAYKNYRWTRKYNKHITINTFLRTTVTTTTTTTTSSTTTTTTSTTTLTTTIAITTTITVRYLLPLLLK